MVNLARRLQRVPERESRLENGSLSSVPGQTRNAIFVGLQNAGRILECAGFKVRRDHPAWLAPTLEYAMRQHAD